MPVAADPGRRIADHAGGQLRQRGRCAPGCASRASPAHRRIARRTCRSRRGSASTRPRRKAEPAAQRGDDVAERVQPADARAPRSRRAGAPGASAARRSRPRRRRSPPGCALGGAISGVTQRKAGERAQHRGAAIDRRRQHQRRPQDHPIEIERQPDALRPAALLRAKAVGASAVGADRRNMDHAADAGALRRRRTARRCRRPGRARTSSRAPSCNTPTQLTTASMPASSGSQSSASRELEKSAAIQRA